MVCYYPWKAWLPTPYNPNPKTGDLRPTISHPFVNAQTAIKAGWREIQLPCGQCIGCRLEKAAQWAMRCMHESQLYECNAFITLTFSDEHLAPDLSLHKEDFVLFMKRLRKYMKYHFNCQDVRFFHCGEYGDLNSRPHHHAILFNVDFPDRVLWKQGVNKVPIYRSEILEKLWPYGYSSIGNVTYQSCGYVARYVLKKVTGKKSQEYYGNRVPPYITMSRRPGIGKNWMLKYYRDVYPNDFCVTSNGSVRKPPRYYDDIYDYLITYVLESDLPTLEEIKHLREEKAKLMDAKKYDSEKEKMDRLNVRAIVKERQIESLKRSL